MMKADRKVFSVQGEGKHIAGSLIPDSASTTHHMWQEYTQQGLYRQLFHFRRQLDVQRALSKISDQAQRDQAAIRLAPLRWGIRLSHCF